MLSASTTVTALMLHGQMNLDIFNDLPRYFADNPGINNSSIHERIVQLSYNPNPANPRLDWNASLAKNLMVVGIMTTEPMIIGTGRATKEEYDAVVGQVAEDLDVVAGLGGRIKVVWGQKI